MLQGKVCLVVGANTAIGSAVAKRFAFEGASLIITSKSLLGLSKLDEEIKKLGKDPTLIQLDILDSDQMLALVASVGDMFGKLDVILACDFCLGKPNLLIDYEQKTIKEIVDTNLYAQWSLVKNFDALCRLSEYARMIFVTIESFLGKKTSSFAPYNASQAGFLKILECYTKEVSHTEIKANIIALEDYIEDQDYKLSSGFSNLFLQIALKTCSVSGKKHYLKYK